MFSEPDAVSPHCVLLYVLFLSQSFLNASLVPSDTSESSDLGSAPLQESSRPDPPQSQLVSSLRLENQLLRSEVASLNQEMASLIQRAKDLQDGTRGPSRTFLYVLVVLTQSFLCLELNQARLRADRWNSEQAQTTRTLQELRSHVDDLTEALSAKDGQLAVLKVRLDEADQLLESRRAALEEVQKEKSRLACLLKSKSAQRFCFTVITVFGPSLW